MYASSADISTIRQKETPKQELHLEHRLKTSQKTGHARPAESDLSTSKRCHKSGHWIWYKAPTRKGYSDSSFKEFI